jgi:hypothetical protein
MFDRVKVAVFGFFKRRRAKQERAGQRAGTRPPETHPSDLEEGADAEPVGRSNWYGSSRELHDGLYVNEDANDVTQPTPLDEAEDPKRH